MKQLSGGGIPLADKSENGDTINDYKILVGANYYYKFIDGITLWDNNILLTSFFVMMLSGPFTKLTSVTQVNVSAVLSTTVKKTESSDEVPMLWSLDSKRIQQCDVDETECEVLEV